MTDTMNVKYIGENAKVEIGGVTMKRGDWCDLPSEIAKHLKDKGNPKFEFKGRSKKAEPEVAEVSE